MDICVSLIVASVKMGTPAPQTECLMDCTDAAQPRIPSVIISSSDTSILQIPRKLLTRLTGLHARNDGTGWINLSQGKIIEDIDSKKVYIPFGCLIPENIDIKDSNYQWINISNIFSDGNSSVDIEMIKQLAYLLK